MLYLIIEKKYNLCTIGAFAMPLAFMALAYASLSPNINDRIQPLLPALKSNWLIAHVITWFIYATLLHARLMRGWQGRRAAIISVLGFGAVLFTYFGVNLLPGLHSYGSM